MTGWLKDELGFESLGVAARVGRACRGTLPWDDISASVVRHGAQEFTPELWYPSGPPLRAPFPCLPWHVAHRSRMAEDSASGRREQNVAFCPRSRPIFLDSSRPEDSTSAALRRCVRARALHCPSHVRGRARVVLFFSARGLRYAFSHLAHASWCSCGHPGRQRMWEGSFELRVMIAPAPHVGSRRVRGRLVARACRESSGLQAAVHGSLSVARCVRIGF